MKKHSRVILLVLAVIALGASLTSLYVHYKILTDPGYNSFCDVSATVSCEAVYQSAYGTVKGIPVAAFGAIWAGLVLAFTLGMRGEKHAARDAELASYIFALSVVGLATVFYFAYTSFFVLQKLCLLCLTMYGAVVSIFVVSGAASESIGSIPSRLGRDVSSFKSSSLAMALAVAWLALSVSVVAFFPRELTNQTTEAATAAAAAAPEEKLTPEEVADFESWLAQQPRQQLDVDAGGAKVVIVKFNDYQCPACKATYIAYKGLKAKWEKQGAGAVKFITMDYPLDTECNVGGIHAFACEAAAAMRMAKAKNRGEQMEEWLFDNQARFSRDVVKEGAREVAQVNDFDAQYPKMLDAVRADAQKGQKLGITGTPTFFINGIKIGGGLRPAYLDAAIAYELKRAQAATTGGL